MTQLSLIRGDENMANLKKKEITKKKVGVGKLMESMSAGFSDKVRVCVCLWMRVYVFYGPFELKAVFVLFPNWDPNQGNEILRFQRPLSSSTN